MTDPNDTHDELNDLLGRLLEQRDADHEAYTSEREAIALLVVGIERHVAALTLLTEQAKTRLSGIAPSGRAAS